MLLLLCGNFIIEDILINVNKILKFFNKKWGDLLVYDNVKAICDEKGLTIAQVERKAGLKNGAISKWKTFNPKAKNLKAVADVLKVKMEKLLKE